MGSVYCCDDESESKKRKHTKLNHKYQNELKNKAICSQIEHDINLCIHNKTNLDTQKFLNWIGSNETTERFTYNYLQKLVENETKTTLKSDTDEKKLEFENENIGELKSNTAMLKKELVFIPSNVSALIDRMQHAVDKGISIKAMGSRFAMTNITFTKGLSIDMYNGLNDPNMQINEVVLNKYGKQIFSVRNMHLCQAGASVEAILETLWPQSNRRSLMNKDTNMKYKTLSDVAGYAKLCIGGLINTASAGQGSPIHSKIHDSGSLVNQILAYTMIIIDDDKKVRLVQIEPDLNNGAIHDPIEWKKQFVHVELIQNDDIFEAGLVSMGLLGVIYSYYILLDDASFIEENTTLVSYDTFKEQEWDKLIKRMENGEIDSVKLLLSPYVCKGIVNKKFKNSPPILIQMYGKTDNVPVKRWNKDFTTVSSCLMRTAAVINNWSTRILSELAPFLIKMQLKMVNDTDNIVRVSTYLGCVDTSVFVQTVTCGYAINYKFLDDYIQLMDELRTNDRNQVTPLPLCVRFSSYKSRGLLNMFSNDNDDRYGFFWIELIVPNFEKGIDCKVTTTIENVYRIMDKIQELSMSKPYFGNPHLGLYFSVNKDIFKNIKKKK
eukprot:526596_1